MTDIVLIGGLWLRPQEWDAVVAELDRLGHRALPVLLPGQGDGATDVTLDDQVAAVLAAVDDCDAPPLVVGHSAAASLAWLAADARPVAGVALIGGFPVADGEAYADFLPIADGEMPFPGWEQFEGPDAADLDPDTRRALVDRMVPVPEQVARGVVRLADEARYDVDVTLICPEFTPSDAREWLASGELPELAKVTRLHLVDLDSGHWPQVTQPALLAGALAAAAG
ncbi:alpha/beta fold hydrolase [Micropruina sonneratiae]|uniref:alpha/beta fold hydrolase n=1 Tax=Micropruina sonneratiae TaxID=2986940 RepID=UPI002227AF46|nr:alpha/beta fold hydrolase [Micropruina sp. KQZ13P-5]MCW3159154.1 alpha/beta fold hydrolase [Micropruina sp. KQZ13P-5]